MGGGNQKQAVVEKRHLHARIGLNVSSTLISDYLAAADV